MSKHSLNEAFKSGGTVELSELIETHRDLKDTSLFSQMLSEQGFALKSSHLEKITAAVVKTTALFRESNLSENYWRLSTAAGKINGDSGMTVVVVYGVALVYLSYTCMWANLLGEHLERLLDKLRLHLEPNGVDNAEVDKYISNMRKAHDELDKLHDIPSRLFAVIKEMEARDPHFKKCFKCHILNVSIYMPYGMHTNDTVVKVMARYDEMHTHYQRFEQIVADNQYNQRKCIQKLREENASLKETMQRESIKLRNAEDKLERLQALNESMTKRGKMECLSCKVREADDMLYVREIERLKNIIEAINSRPNPYQEIHDEFTHEVNVKKFLTKAGVPAGLVNRYLKGLYVKDNFRQRREDIFRRLQDGTYAKHDFFAKADAADAEPSSPDEDGMNNVAHGQSQMISDGSFSPRHLETNAGEEQVAVDDEETMLVDRGESQEFEFYDSFPVQDPGPFTQPQEVYEDSEPPSSPTRPKTPALNADPPAESQSYSHCPDSPILATVSAGLKRSYTTATFGDPPPPADNDRPSSPGARSHVSDSDVEMVPPPSSLPPNDTQESQATQSQVFT